MRVHMATTFPNTFGTSLFSQLISYDCPNGDAIESYLHR